MRPRVRSGGRLVHAALTSLLLAAAPAGAAETASSRPICGGTRAPGARCDGLEGLTLAGGRVRNARGRAPAPGEAATIEVEIRNPTARAIAYPCVGFAADDAGITFGSDNPKLQGYALAPGATARYAVTAQVASSVRRGATVTFTAWLDVLHGGCTNGKTLVWKVRLP